MEIQYGVLRNPEMLERSAFYFRSDTAINDGTAALRDSIVIYGGTAIFGGTGPTRTRTRIEPVTY